MALKGLPFQTEGGVLRNIVTGYAALYVYFKDGFHVHKYIYIFDE